MPSNQKLRPDFSPALAGLAALRAESGTIRRRVLLVLLATLLAGAAALVYAKLAHAATVTAANASASADTAQTASNTWTSLGNISVVEAANGDFTSPQTNTTSS